MKRIALLVLLAALTACSHEHLDRLLDVPKWPDGGCVRSSDTVTR
jgi:hypothetical protein